MNLRRMAEWCGFVVAGTFIDEETGRKAVDIATDNDTVTLFDPLNDSGDAFTVLAKLCSVGMMCHEFGTPLYFERQVGKAIEFESTTRVTDEASLRRAICEVAEKVSKQ